MSDKRLATLANFSKPYSLLWATVLPKYRCKSLQTLPKYFDVTPYEVAMQILFSLWYSPDVVWLPHPVAKQGPDGMSSCGDRQTG